MIKIMIGVVVAAAIVILGFMLIDPAVNNAVISNSSQIVDSANQAGTFKYTIEGEVYKSGTYTLDESISMADLINAAGGLTKNADDLAFFEDAILKSGETYYIASKYDETDVCNNTPINKVNVNEDNAEELVTITGITSSIASSIVSYRAEHGTFNTLEDLLDVYGIGNATYRKIRNFVTLHS